MASITVAASTVSQPVFAPPGSLVTVAPSAGASAKVEYTKGSAADVTNGVATWATWARGASVSSTTSDVLNEPAYLRVTATSGSVTLTTDETPSVALLDAYRADWASAQTQSSSSTTSGVSVLAQSGVASSVTGTTNETTLATVTIPGGTVGANQSIRVSALFSSLNGTSNKVVKIKIGTTDFFSSSMSATGALSHQTITTIRNRASSGSQVGMSVGGINLFSPQGVVVVTSNIDMSADQNLTITASLNNSGDTVSLEGYTVEVLK